MVRKRVLYDAESYVVEGSRAGPDAVFGGWASGIVNTAESRVDVAGSTRSEPVGKIQKFHCRVAFSGTARSAMSSRKKPD